MSIETIGYKWHSEDARRTYEKAEAALAEHDEQWRKRLVPTTAAETSAMRSPSQWGVIAREFAASRAPLVNIMIEMDKHRSPVMRVDAARFGT